VETAGLGFISKNRGALEIPQLHKHVCRGFASLEPFDLINTPYAYPVEFEPMGFLPV
jgi:hypothetical protein